MDKVSLTRKLLKTHYKDSKKGIIFKTFGSSMWPLIETNDELEIIYTEIKNLKIGDIIVITSNKKYIAHRIISIYPDLRIKGDNTEKEDEIKVNNDNYVGKVISLRKKRFNLKLNLLHLRIYYIIYKLFGKEIKFLDKLRRIYIERKIGNNNKNS